MGFRWLRGSFKQALLPWAEWVRVPWTPRNSAPRPEARNPETHTQPMFCDVTPRLEHTGETMLRLFCALCIPVLRYLCTCVRVCAVWLCGCVLWLCCSRVATTATAPCLQPSPVLLGGRDISSGQSPSSDALRPPSPQTHVSALRAPSPCSAASAPPKIC